MPRVCPNPLSVLFCFLLQIETVHTIGPLCFGDPGAVARPGPLRLHGSLATDNDASTVALRAGQRNIEFVFVDKNPLVERRFPSLKGRLLNRRVESLKPEFPNCKVILFDAPWYVETIIAWLSQAGRIASPGTKIIMPLFPQLTRPAATEEREVVLKFAKSLGRTSIVSDFVEYDCPLFEWEALTSKGVLAHPNWRTADLLLIEAFGGSPAAVAYPMQQDNWETFVIGSQVVQVKLSKRKTKGFFIKPVPQGKSFVLDTVSARDQRRPFIDMLSSRNRAAMVGDIKLVRYVLSMLSQCAGEGAEWLRKSLENIVGSEESESLREFLCWDRAH